MNSQPEFQDSNQGCASSQVNPYLAESDERYGGIYTGDIVCVDSHIGKTPEMHSTKKADETTDSLEKKKVDSTISVGTSSSRTSEERQFPKSSNVLHDIQVMTSVVGASCLPNQVNVEEDGQVIEDAIHVHANKVESIKISETSSTLVKTRSCSEHSTRIETLEHGKNKIDDADDIDTISVLQDPISTVSSQKTNSTTKEKITKNIDSYKSTKEHQSIMKALAISGFYLSFLLLLGVIIHLPRKHKSPGFIVIILNLVFTKLHRSLATIVTSIYCFDVVNSMFLQGMNNIRVSSHNLYIRMRNACE